MTVKWKTINGSHSGDSNIECNGTKLNDFKTISITFI